MSTQFVRYTPDIEATEPNFDQNLQTVIGKLEEYIAGSVTTEGTGRAVRDAHAKGYGVVKAEVEILGQLPADYAQGIYAAPGKHGALIRFSNGQPHAAPDMLLGPVAGMALKIFDINGPTLLEDEPDTGTFDYATINAPVFFCNTLEHYLFIKDLFIEAGQYFSQGREGQHRFFREWVTGKGTLDEDQWAWEELFAFVSLAQVRPVNLLLSNYWTMGAVRHGDYVAKIRMAPVPEFASRVARPTLDLASAPEVYRPALAANCVNARLSSTFKSSFALILAERRSTTLPSSGLSRCPRSSRWPRSASRSRTFRVTTTSRRWTRCHSRRGG